MLQCVFSTSAVLRPNREAPKKIDFFNFWKLLRTWYAAKNIWPFLSKTVNCLSLVFGIFGIFVQKYWEFGQKYWEFDQKYGHFLKKNGHFGPKILVQIRELFSVLFSAYLGNLHSVCRRLFFVAKKSVWAQMSPFLFFWIAKLKVPCWHAGFWPNLRAEQDN